MQFTNSNANFARPFDTDMRKVHLYGQVTSYHRKLCTKMQEEAIYLAFLRKRNYFLQKLKRNKRLKRKGAVVGINLAALNYGEKIF